MLANFTNSPNVIIKVVTLNMKKQIKFLACLVGLNLFTSLNAAVPPAEQLLPADTLVIVSIPDWSKSIAYYQSSPIGKLWQDTEVKALKEKFLTKFQSSMVGPLEKELGIKFSDYTSLFQGQITLGFSIKGIESGDAMNPSWLLLMDSKDKTEDLKKNLADLKKKWTDGGKQLKSEKIRDVEFSTLSLSANEFGKIVQKAFNPDNKDTSDNSGEKIDLIIGQSDSLLIIGNNNADIEKVIVKQTGGQSTTISEQSDFQSNQAMFRDSLVFGWLNLRPVVSFASKKVAQMASAMPAGGNPMAPKPDKVLAAIGIDGLKAISFSILGNPEGELVHLFVNAPESNRKGLLKLFSFESKGANPPAFIPADAINFSRTRMDGQKMFSTIEGMISEISPEIGGFLQMGLAAAGKDKDPNFDLKKSLIGNIGDDIITYQKAPKTVTVADLESPPTMVLIGSSNADELLKSMYTGASLVVAPNAIKERDFLGKKVYTVAVPAMPNSSGEEKILQVGSTAGYVAFSTDVTIFEEFLRSSEQKPKPLDEVTGLKDAAQKVGGMNSGMWGYENHKETIRMAFELLKKDASSIEKLFDMGSAKGMGELKEWIDFSLLPSYDKVAKYFSYSIYSGILNGEGFSFKYFTPNPPGMN